MANDNKNGHWIENAIQHKGSFTAEAKSAGKSVKSFAKEKEHAKGTIGKRARLAETLSTLRKRK